MTKGGTTVFRTMWLLERSMGLLAGPALAALRETHSGTETERVRRHSA